MSIYVTMEIFRIVILFLPFCFYSALCFPSRPLNERSTELAWQAWLLVDDQNQNKQNNPESFTRRRITPKSVFIAPTFSPESLPACADGYRPDSMGRCIKIIKLDEEAHLDFLLEKLNAQFGDYDEMEEDSQENLPTAGPFQLNIPLNAVVDENDKDNLDIAIVVAPTNGNFALSDEFKADVKRTSLVKDEEDMQKKLPEVEQSNNDDSTMEYKVENRFPEVEQVTETTTVIGDETTPTNFAEVISITTEDTTISTTITVPTESTTLDIESDTTISERHALFFLKPSLINTKHVQNGTNNAEDTPNVTSSYSFTISNDSLTTLLPDQTTTELNNQKSANINFPTQEEEETTYHNSYVKFPEKVTQTDNLPYVNMYASRFQHGMDQEFINTQNLPLSPQNTERPFNHRNRDKSNFWLLPPSWRESSPQKPIVLRFSGRSNRHLLEEHLRPQNQNFQTFYREVPSEEFSYIFGIDPDQSRRKHRR